MLRCIRSLTFLALLLGTASVSAHELAQAAQRGDVNTVQALLANGVDPDTARPDGATALHWAAHRADADTVKVLLDAGADPAARNLTGMTPLALAAEAGSARVLSLLLAAGAAPNDPLPNGETALMMAARTGNPEALVALLDAGAEVEAREKLRGTTALMWAASYGNPDAVRVLIDAGADIGARSDASAPGRGPYLGEPARERIADFLEGVGLRGAALAVDEHGNPIEPDPDSDAAEALQVVQLPGGRVNPVDSQGRPIDLDSAPHLGQLVQGGEHDTEAFRRTRAILMDFLEDDPRDAQRGGMTALVYAARISDIESARLLLEAGADVNQTTYFDVTPLLAAVQNRYYRMAHFLLDHGADPTIANRGGWTPLYLAVKNRNIEAGDYPVRRPDEDDLVLIRRLLDDGADPNARMRSSTETRTVFTQQWLHEEGATPFLRAAQSGDMKLLKLLLEYGADPHMPTYHGVTPLMVASGIGWVQGVTFEHSPEQTLEVVKLLLELGADVNHQDWVDYRTALMGAAHKGRPDVIELLLEHGADPGLYDIGSRDSTHVLAGVAWQAVDYADGLVRVGVQSAEIHEDAAEVLRSAMIERGMDPPPPGRTLQSICVPSADGRSVC